MTKRVLKGFMFMLIGCFAVYMYVNKEFQVMKAQSAPAFQLPKGSKVVLGKYNNKEIVWDIGNNDNNGSYVLMSSKPLVNAIATYDGSVPITTTAQNIADRENYCLKYDSSSSTSILFCPVAPLNTEIAKINTIAVENAIITRSPFLPTLNEISSDGTLGLSLYDRAYKSTVNYWIDGYITSLTYNSGVYTNKYHNAIQQPLNEAANSYGLVDYDTRRSIPGNERLIWCNSTLVMDPVKRALRPFTLIDKAKIMFAANTTYTDGQWHSYSLDNANLNENNELNPNKLRTQSSLTASLQDIKRNNQSTSKIMKNSSVDLSVTANTGTNTKMSVILYNDAGTDILYYKLGNTTLNGTNDYSIDLTGVAVGKYKLAVINEEFDHSSQLPVESSMISDLLPLEIVEPHKLTYTKQPQSGATSGNDYEYSKNVNAGQVVGKITVNPQGVMPLTYTIESNGDNSYQNFEINGLNGNGASNSTSLDVVIKSGAPDLVNGSLKAGAYKFCVSAVDANGDPTTATSDSKVCTTLNVAKTNTTIVFNDPNMTKK